MPSTLPQKTIDELLARYRAFRKNLWTVVRDHRIKITGIVEQADEKRVQDLQRKISSGHRHPE